MSSSTLGALSQETGQATKTAMSGAKVAVSLLTGGFDRPYAIPLSMALVQAGARLDVIGSDELEDPLMHTTPNLRFLNLRGSKKEAGFGSKASRLLAYYARLLRYAAQADARIFHILWNNKFELFDRTVLMLYYKLLGKKIVLTAHNVNAGKRDAQDSLLNRMTLRVQYHLADHIFVHTEKMKTELLEEFRPRAEAVSVIPFGMNTSVPNTALTAPEARRRLGIEAGEKTILFFGAIRPYKGLEYLVEAFLRLAAEDPKCRLIIAGEQRRGDEKYIADILARIDADDNRERIIRRIQYIPDEETELYFKAADVLALPYTHVFQSGVLFLGYGFGLPVVATDVGSVGEEVVEGQTGFLCRPRDAGDLTRALAAYFESDLYEGLSERRQEIMDFAHARHSWDIVGARTQTVYSNLLGAGKS